MRPIDVDQASADRLWVRLYGNEGMPEAKGKPNGKMFKKNDAVRLALDKPVFRKGTLPTFTDEIFLVDSVVVGRGSSPTHYYIRDQKGERIKGKIYGPDLTKVRLDAETTYRIERVIRRRKNTDGSSKILVKFIGYPDTYWLTDSDFV